MVNRLITQPGAVPMAEDILNVQRNQLIQHGWFMNMVMGSATAVTGLGCIPTSPPSMSVQINPGMLCQGATIDATQFGTLPLGADNVSPLVKSGILPVYDPTTMLFALAAPTQSGQSINYLIEASFLEVDDTPLVLPYFNSANPLQAFLGPNGSGTSVFTNRAEKVQLQLKAGVPAVDGFQVTPSADAGWVPLWIITVKFGDTSINSSRIVQHPAAPFVTNKLPQLQPLLGGRIRRVLATNLNIYVSPTGSNSNDGQTPATPFQTLQHCWDYIQGTLDLNNFGVQVNLANGTYTSGVVCVGSPVGFGNGSFVNFVGNIASPSSVVVSVTDSICFNSVNLAIICLQGMTLTSTGSQQAYHSGGICINCNALGSISLLGSIIFGAAGLCHIQTGSGGIVQAVGFTSNVSTTTYTIAGSAQYHIVVDQLGQVYLPYVPISITGTPNFSVAFVSVIGGGWISFTGTTWNGTSVGTGLATGTRYNVSFAGAIYTNGAGANFLPGTVAGTTNSGSGFYT